MKTPKKKRKGPPYKYLSIIEKLEPGTLYTPADIARFAQDKDLLREFLSSDVTEERIKHRLRMALHSIIHNRANLPAPQKVKRHGQAHHDAWYGHQWQSMMGLDPKIPPEFQQREA